MRAVPAVATLVPAAGLSLVLLTSGACRGPEGVFADTAADESYPPARRESVVDTLHGVEISDPYRWLEDGESAEVREWIDRQDDLARRVLSTVRGRERTRKRLRELAYRDTMSPPERRENRYFYWRRSFGREKAVLCWREGHDGAERVLLDPARISADGSISLGVATPDHQGRRVAYTLRENNADEATLQVVEVDSGQVSPRDVIPGAKYARPSWTPDGRGFFYTWLPSDGSIPADVLPGHAQVRFHLLGSDPAADPVVFGPTGDPTRFLSVELSDDGRWLLVYESVGWVSTEVWFRDLSVRGSRFQRLVGGLPARFDVSTHGDRFFAATNYKAPRGRVVRIDPRRPAPEDWIQIVPESPDSVIEDGGMRLCGERIVISSLRDAASRLHVYSLSGELVREVKLPAAGEVGPVACGRDDDEAYFEFSSFTEPGGVQVLTLADGSTRQFHVESVPIEPGSLSSSRVTFRSADGTEVGMFLLHRADLSPNGRVPTLLYGYGGFGLSQTPSFNPWVIPFVERGGLYAVAGLRGGSERGEEWHEAGMLERKQKVFDDFFAAAEWLIRSGWTDPRRLAIRGRSNGGLLVGAAMTQRPELFRAVVCGVPLLDMLRYHLFGSGRTWISEYGSAEREDQFLTLLDYSPYHRLAPQADYPALLMLSADHDDRVDPLHARKFVAALQAGKPGPWRDPVTLLRVERGAGHGGADSVAAEIEKWVDIDAFLSAHLVGN
jgi:prolyl oligopeptidase